MHSGVSRCDQSLDRLLCNDETYSPSCPCSERRPILPPSTKVPPIIGKDILVKDDKAHPVHIEHLRQEVKDSLGTVTDIWKAHDLRTPVITSGNDGVHPDERRPSRDCSNEARCRATSGSRHYQDLAVDIHSKDIKTMDEKLQVEGELKKQLDPRGYYVKLEDRGTKNEHFHIQYNPPQVNKIVPKRSKK